MYMGIQNISTVTNNAASSTMDVASFGKVAQPKPPSRRQPVAKAKYTFILGAPSFTSDADTNRTNFHIPLQEAPQPNKRARQPKLEFPSPAGSIVITPGDEGHRRQVIVYLRPKKPVGSPDPKSQAKTRAKYHGRVGGDDLNRVYEQFTEGQTIYMNSRFHLIPPPKSKKA